MLIDVSNVLKIEGASEHIDIAVDISFAKFSSKNSMISTPVKVDATLTNIGGSLQLAGNISGIMDVKCDRCMKSIKYSFAYNLEETFAKGDFCGNCDSEVTVFQGNEINITDVVVNNICINMPMKFLCSPQCKGLCPICGKDLNLGDCECNKQDIDPRLEVLKKLLD